MLFLEGMRKINGKGKKSEESTEGMQCLHQNFWRNEIPNDQKKGEEYRKIISKCFLLFIRNCCVPEYVLDNPTEYIYLIRMVVNEEVWWFHFHFLPGFELPFTSSEGRRPR